MYEFHHTFDSLKKNVTNLSMTDTDSSMYDISTDDLYKDISDDINECFNTCSYPKNHPSSI